MNGAPEQYITHITKILTIKVVSFSGTSKEKKLSICHFKVKEPGELKENKTDGFRGIRSVNLLPTEPQVSRARLYGVCVFKVAATSLKLEIKLHSSLQYRS